MQVKECIILAGGLGTRLRSAVPDMPKTMAPVAGKPFLHHVIKYLKEQGIERYIFSLGYMHEVIEDYIKNEHPDLDVVFSIEEEPLGTGGAIKTAASFAKGMDVLIVNGDTLFKVKVEDLARAHSKNPSCTLGLKPMQDFERYGVVEINDQGVITSFKEKQHYESGLINGGVYILNTKTLQDLALPEKFSFEKDFLEVYYKQVNMNAVVQESYFIDIGIPEDFAKANEDLKI